MSTVKVKIKKYDASVTEPPFQFITLGEFECDEKAEDDRGGVDFARTLHRNCSAQGHRMKFYSLSSDEGYDYDVCVYGEMELV